MNLSSGWTTVAEKPLVLVKGYSFGGGHSNCLAVLLPQNKWLLMSPPPKLTPEDILTLQSRGEVVALVENNGFHHLGLGPCRAQFPGATTYARERAAARIRKKGKDYGELAPVEQLAPLLGPDIDLVPLEGDKVGDLLMRIRTDRGVLLFSSDYIVNIPQLPKSVVPRALFKLTNSAPGLKVFNLFVWMFVANRTQAKASVIRAIEEQPPSVLVPAHGDVLSAPDLSTKLLGLLR